MPRGDRTGPAGMGPMTGRAAGYCAGYPTPGYMNPYGGRMGGGFGWGGGRGRGWRAFPGAGAYYALPYMDVPYGPAYTPEQELGLLQNQAKALGDQLAEIQKRISELETGAGKK